MLKQIGTKTWVDASKVIAVKIIDNSKKASNEPGIKLVFWVVFTCLVDGKTTDIFSQDCTSEPQAFEIVKLYNDPNS